MKLKVLHVRKETPSIITVVFEKLAGFMYKPGQYMSYFLPVQDPKGNTRQFSIASSPTEDVLLLSFRDTNSIFKQKLKNLNKNDAIDAKGPYGSFILDTSKPAIMLSGGVGITPLRSMIKFAADSKLKTNIILFYSNRTPEEIAFKREFEGMEKKNKNIKIIHTITNLQDSKEKWSGLTGYIDAKMISSNVKNAKDSIFYICGPPAMVDAMADLLKNMNIPDEQVRIEHFTGY